MSEETVVEFEEACRFVRGIAGKVGKDDLLYFYARFKQANEGTCTAPKPSFYQLTEKSKWQAWLDLGDLSGEEAREQYIERLDCLEPEWRGLECKDPTSGWINVSCPKLEENIAEDEKTLFDRVKEEDLVALTRFLNPENVKVRDENGLSLLHWAADRGHLDIAQFILNLDQSLVNQQDEDGQSPLHYASSCGHAALVRLLLNHGANSSLQDSDGLTPNSADTEPEIRKIFTETLFS